jgi:hypothetical protein
LVVVSTTAATIDKTTRRFDTEVQFNILFSAVVETTTNVALSQFAAPPMETKRAVWQS